MVINDSSFLYYIMFTHNYNKKICKYADFTSIVDR